MIKFFSGLIGLLVSTHVLAANIFITKSDPNNINYSQCNVNHYAILNENLKIVDSQIALLTKGLHEESINTSRVEEQVTAYKKLLLTLILDRVILKEMTTQLANTNFEAQFGKKAEPKDRVKKVFNLEDIQFELEPSVHVALKEAIEKHHHDHTLLNYATHKLEHELVAYTIKLLSIETFKAIGKGIMAKIMTGSVANAAIQGITTKTILSFGHHVVEGALVGTVISLASEPLKGGRPAPDKIWLDILWKNPEFMINPEWMNKLGSPDHPWETHCYTIQEKTEPLEKRLQKALRKRQSAFSAKLMSIYQAWDKVEVSTGDSLLQPVEKDNTSVKVNTNEDLRLPIWAR